MRYTIDGNGNAYRIGLGCDAAPRGLGSLAPGAAPATVQLAQYVAQSRAASFAGAPGMPTPSLGAIAGGSMTEPGLGQEDAEKKRRHHHYSTGAIGIALLLFGWANLAMSDRVDKKVSRLLRD